MTFIIERSSPLDFALSSSVSPFAVSLNHMALTQDLRQQTLNAGFDIHRKNHPSYTNDSAPYSASPYSQNPGYPETYRWMFASSDFDDLLLIPSSNFQRVSSASLPETVSSKHSSIDSSLSSTFLARTNSISRPEQTWPQPSPPLSHYMDATPRHDEFDLSPALLPSPKLPPSPHSFNTSPMMNIDFLAIPQTVASSIYEPESTSTFSSSESISLTVPSSPTAPPQSTAGLDFNGRKPRQWANRRYRCSHCNLSFLDKDLELYALHVEEVESRKGGIQLTRRKYKCPEKQCPWHRIGFFRKLEAQKHFARKHGVPQFECRYWSETGEKYPGCGVCTTRWHADSGNRTRHEQAIHGATKRAI
jgi:hypothetical protein